MITSLMLAYFVRRYLQRLRRTQSEVAQAINP
ncbi:hypothetical protein Pla8534_11690 [Lignipirellula cremea]|uniref:Uncharacterized protein n=1 Tax=Lignipirellula cremea TaxID=2528010 RepID=A0A518DNH7_9BACT|nr:hypothetical protein Pla8534_11690 [Lignipirellula cremea]